MMIQYIDKPFYVSIKDAKKFTKGEIRGVAPYGVKLKVLDVYHNNWIKQLLRSMGFKVRINQIKVIKTNISNQTI